MKVKVISLKSKDKNIMEKIENDLFFVQFDNFSVHDDYEKKGYFRIELYLEQDRDERQLISFLHETYPSFFDFQTTVQGHDEWLEKWSSSLKPVWVSKRFLVDPAAEKKDEVILIRITPGMAFGTGNHETTRLAGALIEKHANKGHRVLDMGCGSGILSIMSAKLGCSVTAVDMDQFSLDATAENVQKNDVSSSVSVLKSDLLTEVKGKYDIIVANILYDVLRLLFEDNAQNLKRVLYHDSVIIFSGLLNSQYDKFAALIEKSGFSIIERQTEGDWFAIAVHNKNI